MIVCIALKNKTIGFLEQNSVKRERDNSMKSKWTLFFNSFAWVKERAWMGKSKNNTKYQLIFILVCMK